MKDEKLERLLRLWELLEEERGYIKLPNSWERRKKPSKRQLPRLSIRTWDDTADWYLMNIYWMFGGLVHHLVSARAFPNDNCTRFDVLLTAWKLGDFIRLARDAELRFFIEHLQQFANAIVENMDEDETAP